MPLPAPLDDPAKDRAWGAALARRFASKYECGLDDTCAVSVPQPKTPEEEKRLVAQVSLRPGKAVHPGEQLDVSPAAAADHGALHALPDVRRMPATSSKPAARNELYRPAFRSEILRRLYFKYVKHGGLLSAWQHGDIELNWPLVARLDRTVLPLQPVPPLRADLSDRRRQRPGGARTAKTLQPGDGHRSQGTARARARCCS